MTNPSRSDGPSAENPSSGHQMDYIRIVRALLHVSPIQLAADLAAASGEAFVKPVSVAPLMQGHEGLAAGLRAIISWYQAEMPEAPLADNRPMENYLALRSRWEEQQAMDIVVQMREREKQRAREHTRRQTSGATPPAADPVARRQALLVDDASDVVVTVSAFVESFGFDVTRASSADAAFALLAEGRVFDLLVTDHAMPGMTGKDLAVQACQMNKALRALIITGFPDARDLSVLPEGVMLLAKPFRRAELAACVRRLFATDAVNNAVPTPVE